MTGDFALRRLTICGLLLCAVLSFGLGIALWLPGAAAQAQDEAPPAQEEQAATEPAAQDAPELAEYVGAGDCGDCHRGLAQDHEDSAHAQALLDVSRRKQGILADFDSGEDLRMVQFPGEDAPRAFGEDDISLAIGAGRYLQRYVVELDDDLLAVLPAEWDTINQVWQPYTRGETWPGPEYDFVANCAGCHTVGLEIERGRWEDDGVQCEACHGPGSIHVELAEDAGRRPSEEEIAGIHAAIVVSPDAQICGQCHSQGMTPDSAHPYPIGFRPGGDLLDPAMFQLQPEDDGAAWYDSGHGRLMNMQFNEWLTSGHADSLDTLQSNANAQDECLACHSGDVAFHARILAAYEDETLTGEPPAAPTVTSATVAVTCTTCHSPHAGDNDFQLVSDAYELCTSCHRNTELVQPLHHPVVEMFEGQTVVDTLEGIPSAHFIEEEGPRCVTCHMAGLPVGGAQLASHTWQPVIPGERADSPPDACSTCHDDLLTNDLESLVLDTQAVVKGRLSVAWARLGSVAQPEADTEAAANYNRVVAALTFVQNDGSLGVHNYAYVDALLREASNLLSQLSVPGAQVEPTQGPHPTATPSALQSIAVGPELPARTGVRPMTLIIIGGVTLLLLGGAVAVGWQARRKARNQETAP